MESSFTPGCKKVVNADGSYQLVAGSAGSVRLHIFMAIIVVPSVMLLAVLSIPVALLTFIAVLFFWIRLTKDASRVDTILIKPSEGLIFGGKQLPFKAMQIVGVRHKGDRHAQVYVESNGINIDVTGYLSPPIAQFIKSEILKASNT